MLKKLTSRKFLAALAGVIAGMATIFGLDSGVLSTVSGAFVTLGSLIAYIAVEGKIDAAAVNGNGSEDTSDGERVVNDVDRANIRSCTDCSNGN